MQEIVKRRTHIAITDYYPSQIPALESWYSYRETMWGPYIQLGCIYDKETRELRIFGGSGLYRIERATGGRLPVRQEYGYDVPKPISMRLQGFPRSSLQQKMIQFLIAEGSYSPNNNAPQLSCNADTGEGKTFCTIASITHYRVKTMIIVNRVEIKKTWINEIKKFTDNDGRRICDLDSDTIKEFIKGRGKASHYDIFVVVHATVRSVAKQLGWEAIGRLFERLGIGLKIYDESHMEFGNTTLIECYTRTMKTMFLTATPRLTDPKADRIYQKLFEDIPNFNQFKLGYFDSKKHIVCSCIRYNSYPSMDWQKKCYNHFRKQFSASKHSDYQVEEDPHFFTVIDTLIKNMVVKNKYRTLILVAKIESCKIIAEFIKDNFSGLKVGVYNSSIAGKEKERVLEEDQVIVSTVKSLGISKTIDNLQFVLNCEAHRNAGDQASGRLRRLDDPNKVCMYAEIVDVGFKSIRNQWQSRQKHYREIFRELYMVDI